MEQELDSVMSEQCERRMTAIAVILLSHCLCLSLCTGFLYTTCHTFLEHVVPFTSPCVDVHIYPINKDHQPFEQCHRTL